MKRAAAFAAFFFLCAPAACRAEEKKEPVVLSREGDEIIIEEDGVVKNVKLSHAEKAVADGTEKVLNHEFTADELRKHVEELKRRFVKKDAPTGDEKEIMDEAEKILKRSPEEAAKVDPENIEHRFDAFQSDRHEKFVKMLERYLTEFAEKAKNTDSPVIKALLTHVEALKKGIHSYLIKLDHMHDVIDIARQANGLPVEERKN